METKDNDIIYAKDVLELFDGKLTYRVLLQLVRGKKIPALKLGNRLVFSRRVVTNWRDKKLGRVD